MGKIEGSPGTKDFCFNFSDELIYALSLMPQNMSIINSIGYFREQKIDDFVSELSYFIEEFGGGFMKVKILLKSLHK